MRLPFLQMRKSLGMDPGAHSIKWVNWKGHHSAAFESLSLADNPAPWQKVGELCKNKRKQVVFSVSDEKTEIHEIVIPKVPPNEIDSVVRWELKKKNLDLDSMVYDWFQPEDPKENHLQVVVAPRDRVLAEMQPVQELGFDNMVLETQALALVNYVRHYHQTKESFAILDLGYGSFRIIFADEGRILLTRSLYFGLSTLFQRAENEIHVPAADVELLLGEQKENPVQQKCARLLEECLYTLCEEVGRSQNFIAETKSVPDIGHIYICGGGACLYGVLEYLVSHLGGKPLELLDPFRFIEVRSKTTPNLGPLWACAVGLSLHGVPLR